VKLLATIALACALAGIILLADRRARRAGAALVAAGLVAFGLTYRSTPPLSPATLAAMEAVLTRCSSTPPLARPESCRRALEAHHDCQHDGCTARDQLDALIRAGFSLPSN
jgi:hypothetical protein